MVRNANDCFYSAHSLYLSDEVCPVSLTLGKERERERERKRERERERER
jgi:hypothetical protein